MSDILGRGFPRVSVTVPVIAEEIAVSPRRKSGISFDGDVIFISDAFHELIVPRCNTECCITILFMCITRVIKIN